jgi:hypothetical protein
LSWEKEEENTHSNQPDESIKLGCPYCYEHRHSESKERCVFKPKIVDRWLVKKFPPDT